MMRLEGTSLRSDYMRFIVPSILAQWVFSLYTAVDGWFVAHGVSVTAMTAVNLSSPFVTALFAIALMFAVGSSTIVAISLGEGHQETSNQVFTQNAVFLTILSLVLMAGVLLNLGGIAHFLGARGETVPYVKPYIATIAAFTVAFVVSYSFEILLKTDGYPRKAIVIVTVGVVLNCILDFLFVMVFHWGVFGAAFATGLSQVAVIMLYLRHFLSERATLHFVRFRWNVRWIGRAMRNGLSSGITEMSSGIAVFFFNHMIQTHLGADALVSYTIINYVSAIFVYSMTGIAQGSQPLISYYYGKRQPTSIARLVRYGLMTAMAFTIVTVLLVWLGAGTLAAAFIPASMTGLRLSTVHAIRIYCLSFIPVGFTIVLAGYFASVERAAEAITVTLARGVVVLLASLVLMIRWLGGEGIWWAPLVSESFCLALAIVMTVRRPDCA